MSRRKLAVAVALLACVLGGTATAAYATFVSSPSATQAISTQTLQPPTGASAALTSQCKSTKTQQVTVTWTATTSAFATGYTITRSPAFASSVTVSAATTSWVDNTVAHSTAYTYTVLATYQQWSSGVTPGAVTTC
jgi:hypothetical protein